MLNSRGILCVMDCLKASHTFQVYQSVGIVHKEAVYSYGGAKTHNLAQQKCMGEMLERVALRLYKSFNPNGLYGSAGGFTDDQAKERAHFELIERITFTRFLEKNKDFKPKKKTSMLISEKTPPYTYMCIKPFFYKGKNMYATGLCTKKTALAAKRGAKEESIVEQEVKRLVSKVPEKNLSMISSSKENNIQGKPSTRGFQNLTPNFYASLKYAVWSVANGK